MLHANSAALCVTCSRIEAELLPIKVLHCGNRDFFTLFCSYDFDLDPMTFIYELDPYSLEIYRISQNELAMSRLSKVTVLQTYRPTDRHDRNYIPRRFAGRQQSRM